MRQDNRMNVHSRLRLWTHLPAAMAASLMLSLSTPCGAMAQNTSAKITVKGGTLEQAMSQIEHQCNMTFLLSTDNINTKQHVNANLKDVPLKDALAQMLDGTGISYSFSGNQIVLARHQQAAARQQQQPKGSIIKGRVLDSTGEPIIGASVFVKGTKTGAVTDIDGNYQLTASPNATLVVSYIGFKDMEVKASEAAHITLRENTESLGEIVVVGYGTQKKANLTGAVSSVKMDDVLGNRPLSTVNEALQGAVPGLQVTGTSGVPGEGMSFNVRGVNSINSGSPLVLVDNVEMDINMLDPNDIESVTVLKDAASSAIYGARAAFGVILVTTKKGEESAFHINYSNNFSFSRAANIPRKATPLQTVQAYKDQGCVDYRTGQDVDTWLKLLNEYNADPSKYPGGYTEVNGLRYNLAETDLYADMMETGFKQTHNVSLSGGNKKVNYRIGLGVVDQDGILYSDKDSFRRYNMSSYVKADMTSWLTAELDVKYARSNSAMPYTNAPYGIWGAAVAFPSYFPTGDMDINGEVLPVNTPRNFIALAGQRDHIKNDTRIFGKITLKPIKHLQVIGEYTFNYKSSEKTLFDKKFEYAHGDQFRKEQSVSNSKYTHTQDNTDYNAINFYANYSRSIADHDFTVMAGFNQESNDYRYNTAYRTDMINEELPSLSQATGAYYASDDYSRYTVRGLFYRLTYAYKGKYLFENNGRYDGSSKFPKKNRFGFFPSVSAGWRVSEENFMEWSRKVVSNLKLRMSWGNIGNQNISAYAYIPGMESIRANWVVGDEKVTTLQKPKLVSNTFTWEKVSTLDFGVDLGLFNNRLNMVFDWYNRQTKGMLAPGMQLPGVLGAAAPLQNTADLESNGWELSLNWNDRIGKVNYRLGMNLYDSRTKITKYNNETGLIGSGTYRKGMYLGEIWGYVTDRLYQASDFDDNGKLKEGMPRVEGYTPKPGDVLYKDMDGNGIINNGTLTTSDPGDRTIIGNSTRRYQYGINGGVDWNGFSLSFILQGVGKRDLWLMNELTYPIYDPWSTLYSNQLDYWTPERTAAFYPRLYKESAGNTKANTLTQTRYLLNGAYLTIKNITLTYALPRTWLKHIGLSRAAVFVSGENLCTFDHLPKGVDAERVVTSDYGSRGFTYPYMRQFSFGVNVTL